MNNLDRMKLRSRLFIRLTAVGRAARSVSSASWSSSRLRPRWEQALPQEKRWLAADNVALLVDHIHALRVRGAPLIENKKLIFTHPQAGGL
jgi:hypothetical protein